MKLQDIVDFVLSNILPDDVQFFTEVVEDKDNYIINLQVANEFKPLIIGRAGKSINAIRSLLLLSVNKPNKAIRLKLTD